MLFVRLFKIVWALPYTVLGLMIGLAGLCTGGKVLRRWPLEFCDGGVCWILSHLFNDYVMAMALGHVILGRTESARELCRRHELVHVRQYQRWGPFLLPAYYVCYLYLQLRGKDGYRENPFEKEACGE